MSIFYFKRKKIHRKKLKDLKKEELQKKEYRKIAEKIIEEFRKRHENLNLGKIKSINWIDNWIYKNSGRFKIKTATEEFLFYFVEWEIVGIWNITYLKETIYTTNLTEKFS